MKRYAEYKDSGIPWIGTIPSTWCIGRPKYNYYLKGRIGWQGLKSNEFVDNTPYYLVTGTDFRNGRVDWNTCYHITKERYEEAPEIHVQSGDLLVTKDGTIGKVAYIEDKPDYVSLNSHLLLMRPLNDQFDNRFLFWVIQCQVFENYYGVTQSGSIMASLSQEKISNFTFPLPSIEEQSEIANYLERRVKTIVSLIDEAKASIEEYKAWKASIIYEAVTKGLDKGIEMKDSGVEWIGKIPVHWNRIKSGRVIRSTQNGITRRDLDKSEGHIVLKLKNISADGNIDYSEPNRIELTDNEINTYRLCNDDLLFVRVNGSRQLVGKCAVFHDIGEIVAYNDHIIRTKLSKEYDVRFMQYYLLSPAGKREIELHTSTSAGQFTISGEGLRDLSITFPPIQEQCEIVKYLDMKCGDIDTLISEKELLVSDLEANKKSLIFETVTGKRKVV